MAKPRKSKKSRANTAVKTRLLKTKSSAPTTIEELVAANHILYAESVVDGFGHVSARHDTNPDRFWLSRGMAPGLVTAEDVMEYDLDGNPIDARGRAMYAERFIHGEIYRRRADVKAVVHSHSPAVIPFRRYDAFRLLKPIFHMSAFLGDGVPVFEIRKSRWRNEDMLIRNASLGKALALCPATNRRPSCAAMASVAVGNSLPHAVFRAVYLIRSTPDCKRGCHATWNCEFSNVRRGETGGSKY